MTKQEFLAMSLPYKLFFRIEYGSTNQPTGIYQMSGVYETSVVEGFNYDNNVKTDKLKPILHPLSDLTKEIEHNGEVFIPIDKLYHLDMLRCDISFFRFINLDIVADHIHSNKFLEFTLILAKWHFDIAKLIDKGEAIDVNILDKNPYK